MVRLYTAAGRSVVPPILGGLLAVAVVVLLIVRPWSSSATSSERQPTDTPTSTSTSTAGPSRSTNSTAPPRTDPMTQPTGCLGGPERTAASVLAAQAKAGHDSFGAVEVAAAFLRSFAQFPWPGTDQLEAIKPVVASTAEPSFSDFAGAYANYGGNLMPAGLEGTGTPWQVTTVNGKWFVEETSNPDRVNVQLAERYVINGAASTSALVGGYVLVWEDNAWHIEAGLPQDADAIRAGGTYFAGGC